MDKGTDGIDFLPGGKERGTDGFEIGDELRDNVVKVVDVVDEADGNAEVAVGFVGR